jgi:sterol desaturase/sphingolipid hydroxylase (fatty acid hydroxylase superfamily)
MFILVGYESFEWSLFVFPQNVVIGNVDVHFVPVNVGEKLLCAKHFIDLLELIVVICSLEKRFLQKNHSCHHHSQTPDVQ